MSVRHSRLALAALLATLAGCAGYGGKDTAGTTIDMAGRELPESELLDVGIRTFSVSPQDEEARIEAGISAAVRDAESRFMPVHLKNTMQRTGHWGAVRVIPSTSDAVDVVVDGTILRSDGENLELDIEARDVTGRRWFQQRYAASLEAAAYADHQRGSHDPFQDLYNAIANDLASYRAGLDAERVAEIRTVSELRFAASLAPSAFESYLSQDEDGVWHVHRLPARDDPMLERVRRIRDRDYLLVDTITGHYDQFYAGMWDAYVGWREAHAEEAAALRELQRDAMWRKVVGAALVLGGIATAVAGDSRHVNTGDLGAVMVIGGVMVAKSGFDLSAQEGMHETAIRELAVSFEGEIQPLVVEVEGETVELTGSAETQYGQWRDLLERIYLTETGLGGLAPAAAPPSD